MFQRVNNHTYMKQLQLGNSPYRLIINYNPDNDTYRALLYLALNSVPTFVTENIKTPNEGVEWAIQMLTKLAAQSDDFIAELSFVTLNDNILKGPPDEP